MIISPKAAIDQGWLSWTDQITDLNKYLQPNALDFDCATIALLDDRSDAMLSESGKKMRRLVQQNPISHDEYGTVWHLRNGCCYDFSSNFHVKLPAGVAADLIIRSTLNRSGVFLTSGLYDSGFNGGVCGMLRISGGDFYLAPNTRIGQIKFVRSEDSGQLYAGGYNHAEGTHWTDPTTDTVKQLERAHNITADHQGVPAGRQSFI
jgi:deoxycytidine triphosphate deaminase